jgi:hypothetical protein
MPARFTFGENNDVFAFQLTSEWVSVAAKYFIGVAALVSGDLDYAERLLLDVHDQVKAGGSPPFLEIGKRIGRPIAAVYEARTRAALTEYRRSPSVPALEGVDKMANETLRWERKNYNGTIAASYTAFSLRRDVRAAKAILGEVKGAKDPAWKYSQAFLAAYEGKIGAARKTYIEAFKARLPNSELPDQCVDHIRGVLAEEPARYHLHYALAQIAYHVLKDMRLAASEGRAFLTAVQPNDPVYEVTLFRRLVGDAQKAVDRKAS